MQNFLEHVRVLSLTELYRLLSWLNSCLSGKTITYGVALIDQFSDHKDIVEREINNRKYINRT